MENSQSICVSPTIGGVRKTKPAEETRASATKPKTESAPRPKRRRTTASSRRRLPLADSRLDFVRDERAIRMRFVSGRGHYESVVQAVREAKVSVWIATANLKEMLVEDELQMPGRRKSYRSVLATLDRLAARGVELRMLHAEPCRAGPFREELAHASPACSSRQVSRCAAARACTSSA
jgi:hypothetical protein